MNSLPSNCVLNILVTASAGSYRQRIADVLAEKRHFTDLTYAAPSQKLIVSDSDRWDVVILSVPQIEDIIPMVSDHHTFPSLIILYENGEEAQAFSLTHPRIIDILPLEGIQRLPIILQQECKLRRRHKLTHEQDTTDDIRVTEARYRAIVEEQSDLICRYTPDLRLTFANRTYSQQYGKAPEEIIGMHVFDMIPEKDRDKATAHVHSLTRDQPVATSEHRTILPDGSIRWQQWSDRAIFDDEGHIIEYQGVGRDITDTKATQDRLNFLHALILATSTAKTLDDALNQTISLICTAQDWEYGEIWMPDHDEHVLTVGLPHFLKPGVNKEKLQTFWQATQAYQFASGSGIPGRAWSSQSASWTVDVQQLSQSEFLRLEHATYADIHGIVTIPIIDDEDVLAVMVFMAQRLLKPEEIGRAHV